MMSTQTQTYLRKPEMMKCSGVNALSNCLIGHAIISLIYLFFYIWLLYLVDEHVAVNF